MTDAAPDWGGLRGEFGSRGGREGQIGGRNRGGKIDFKQWCPVTKLGRVVHDSKKTLEDICLHSFHLKEFGIIDFLLDAALRNAVLKIMPVQKQTRRGQRTRFKAFVGSKEVATAFRGAIILAKLSVVPVRRGYWGNKIGKPHTVPCKVTGKYESVSVRLIPAFRRTGILSGSVPNPLLTMTATQDRYTSARASTDT